MIPSQQLSPISIGFPPVLTSFTILVLIPIAAIAIIIKNLLSSLNGEKKEEGAPAAVAAVVMRDAAIKYRIKNGKICLKSTLLPADFSSFRVRK